MKEYSQKDITQVAGSSFSDLVPAFWTRYGYALQDMTDDALVLLIKRHIGYDTSRSAIQQYRNGVRFSLPFYIPFALHMNAPISRFILDKQTAALDDRNVIHQHYHLLKDIETGNDVPVPKERFSSTNGLAALWTSERNNESMLPNNQLLIIDTTVNKVLGSGVYVLRRSGKVLVLQLKKQVLDTYSVLTPDGTNQPATDLLAQEDIMIVGKALG